MYKVMIADDEGIVIDSLKYIINKNLGTQCMIEYAKTGRGVIELAERFRPDIAIVDIQMPGINGIEAMREIKRAYSNTIFIVMSAYDKFNYAQEAINLGVMEYLHKPFDQEKIVNVINKAIQIIEWNRQKRSNELSIREKLKTVQPIIENGLIYDILFKENLKDEVDNYKNLLGISMDYGYMCVLLCEDKMVSGSDVNHAVSISLRLQEKYLGVRDLMQEYFQCVIGAVMTNLIPIFIPCSQKKVLYAERIDLIERARECIRKLQKQTNLHFRFGIGSVKPIHDSMLSYNEALKSLSQTTGHVVHIEDLPFGCDYEENYPIDLENQLFDSVRDGNLNETITLSSHFFDWMITSYPDCVMDIKLKSIEFILRAEQIAYVNGGMTYQFCSRQDYLPKLIEFNSFQELRNWFVEKMGNACRNVIGVKQGQTVSVIKVAKDYIMSRYQKDISLDEVSRIVNISPYYFSKIFKDQTGKNFIEYLTELRIEKAKQLLSQTEMSMKEICANIGYTDPNYFSRTFKKNVGITPTDYKEGNFR